MTIQGKLLNTTDHTANKHHPVGQRPQDKIKLTYQRAKEPQVNPIYVHIEFNRIYTRYRCEGYNTNEVKPLFAICYPVALIKKIKRLPNFDNLLIIK